VGADCGFVQYIIPPLHTPVSRDRRIATLRQNNNIIINLIKIYLPQLTSTSICWYFSVIESTVLLTDTREPRSIVKYSTRNENKILLKLSKIKLEILSWVLLFLSIFSASCPWITIVIFLVGTSNLLLGKAFISSFSEHNLFVSHLPKTFLCFRVRVRVSVPIKLIFFSANQHFLLGIHF